MIAAVGGGPAILGFELTGVDGAPDACWTLVVEPPAVQVIDGVDARATSTVRSSRARFDALLANPGRFMHLLMVGELQVRGDQGLAHRVVQLAAIGHCAAPPAVHAASPDAARAFTLVDPSALVPPASAISTASICGRACCKPCSVHPVRPRAGAAPARTASPKPPASASTSTTTI